MFTFYRLMALAVGAVVLAMALSAWPAAGAISAEDRPTVWVVDTEDPPAPDTPPGGGSPGGEPDPPSKPPRPPSP